MRLWNPGDLTVHIGHRLNEKDKKTYHGGPYAETVACLFTDEPMLTLPQATSELSVQRFGPFKQITSGFLVFSYDPNTKSYPIIELTFQQ
jgi:hypothetical protein